mmetsp:Transcript_63285/g.100490  ORF Transcript_63285/g.100490 Transcript_63285/m.100490 type:complete len:213 (-) Transcript_63285:93-731(-)
MARSMPKLKIAGFANAVAHAENGMQTFRRLNGSGRVQNLVKRYEMRGSSQDPSELRVPRAERSSGSRSDRAAPMSRVRSQEDGSEVSNGRARSVDSCRSRGTMSSPVFRARSLDSALHDLRDGTGDLAAADDFSMELSSKRTGEAQGGLHLEETNALHGMIEGNEHKEKEPRPAPMLPLPSRQVVEPPRRRWRCCQCFERLQQHRVPLLSGA